MNEPSRGEGAPQRPFLANFYPIKQPNGLLWYGLDYLRRLGRARVILCRDAVAAVVRRELPDVAVVTGARAAAVEIARAALRGELIYCATPHPIPFISRQAVVLHDLFPFRAGRLAPLKERLFLGALATSRCAVAHINRSVCLAYLRACGLPEERCVYAPNTVPRVENACRLDWVPHGPVLRVGLLGSDSPKKGYGELFDVVGRQGLAGRFHFVVFGFDTAYLQDLRRRYPGIALELVDSSHRSVEEFLASVDWLLSLSRDEGFGRPLAIGLAQRVTAFVARSPIAEEFFGERAELFDDLSELIARLAAAPPPIGSRSQRPAFGELADAADAAARALHRHAR